MKPRQSVPDNKQAIVLPAMPVRTLYICYFGLREPLVQTQVLPYLRQLAAEGIDINLLTFEPELRQRWTKPELANEQARLGVDGIRWFRLPYHKRPSVPATLYDILRGACAVARLSRLYNINVLHARSHVAMAMAMLALRLTNCRLVFDIRGLMAEEYMDAGVWEKDSLPFRLVKKLEREGIRRADQVVVLTKRMREWLIEHEHTAPEKIEVIPCCVDFSRFGSEPEMDAHESSRFELVYAGSVTGLYLLEEMARFFLKLRERRPDAFLRIMTTSSRSRATETLEHAGVSSSDFWVGSVLPEDVPTYLQRAQLGLSFRKPTFSQIAASPTKIAEYLAAGLPVVCNTGIGDVDDLLERERIGVILRSFDHEGYTDAVERILALLSGQEVSIRCRAAARRHFDLVQVGRAGYYSVYHRLVAQETVSSATS